jgi:8-oxo-dGTP diphosphatase
MGAPAAPTAATTGATMDTPTREAPATAPRVGIGVVVVRDGRLLLGLRRGSHGADTWALPGGHLEPGETDASCAARELREETGLVATACHPGPPPVAWTAETGQPYLTRFIVADVPVGEPRLLEPDKCAEWRWCALDALPQPLFGPIATWGAHGMAIPVDQTTDDGGGMKDSWRGTETDGDVRTSPPSHVQRPSAVVIG